MHRFIIAISSLFFFLSGCSDAPERVVVQSESVSDLRINIGENPNTLDPRKARSLCDKTLMNMLYEGLTRINKDEIAEPALAHVIEISEDLKTYTFYLRKAKWSNGEFIRASDFVYSWKKSLDPKFPCPLAAHLYPIKNAEAIKQGRLPVNALGVEALDELTLRVYLEQPTPYFLDLTAFHVYFPICESFDRLNPQWSEKGIYVGCGPFELKQWKHNYELAVVKNESYWDAISVQLSKINMYMVKEQTELQMFEKKELDWIGSPLSNIPIEALASFDQLGSLSSQPMLGTYFLRVNTTSFPLQNKNIRKALALAINRQLIVEHILQGNHSCAKSLVPSALHLHRSEDFQDHDLLQAQYLFAKGLEELKIQRKDLKPLTILFPNNDRNHLLSQALQYQWHHALGIEVETRMVEKKIYFDMLSKCQYDMAGSSWIADFKDPVNFLDLFKSKTSPLNNTGWEDDQYIQLLEASSLTLDPIERQRLLSQCEEILMKDMPIIPLFFHHMIFAKHNHLKDIAISSLGNLEFKWAYVENKDIQ